MPPEKNQKLESDFDPIWSDDFYALRIISNTAFILWRIFISHREDREAPSSISKITDTKIRNITGWNYRTIRKARKELAEAGYIVPQGYHSCLVRNSKRYKGFAESTKPNPPDFSRKCKTSFAENAKHFGRKCETVSHNLQNPINNRPDKDTTDNGQLNNLGGKDGILKTIGKAP